MTLENENKNQIYVLHSDGNYFTRAKKAGFGGYINDPEGLTLIEYTEQIREHRYHFCYEILGLIRGLQLARDMHVEHLVAYGDDKTLMENISSLSKILKESEISPQDLNCLPNNSRVELYIQALELIKEFKSFSCHFIPREENKYSDSLSRKYANLIEKNYIVQFHDDLRRSEQNLERGVRPKRRQFFSVPTMIKMQEKNNPFLVAPSRNRPLRTLSRTEFQNDYQFIFMEVATNDTTKTLRCFYYKDKNSQNNPVILDTKIFDKEEFDINNYAEMLNEQMSKLDHKRPLWFHSNVTQFNAMYEQKEKIPRDDTVFANFVNSYNEMLKFPKVLCHLYPFDHKFSNEIIQKKNKEMEAKQQEIQTMEELFEIFANPKLSTKERKGIFGKMFRYHIKENEEILGRELTDDEKKTYRANFETELKVYMEKRIKEYKLEKSSDEENDDIELDNKPSSLAKKY